MVEGKTTPIRVLLVDDQAVVRIGLRKILDQNSHIQVVAETGTVSTAKAKANQLGPNIILMEVRLPDGNGVEACAKILADCPNTRVIFLTSITDEESMLGAVMAGASGYLFKVIKPEMLVRAIETVAEGHSILDLTVTQHLRVWLHGKVKTQEITEVPGLSVQQFRVLAMVAEGKTNKEIGSSLGLSSNTVRNYLGNIFEKLRITRRTQAAAFFAKQCCE